MFQVVYSFHDLLVGVLQIASILLDVNKFSFQVKLILRLILDWTLILEYK